MRSSIIKGNDEARVRKPLRRRSTTEAGPGSADRSGWEVKDSEGWFGPKFPENVDELHFQVVGVIKDRG